MSSPSPVRYRGNDYPVPTACGHREVPVRGYVHEVAISGGAEVIARHRRSCERENFVFDPLHSPALIEHKINAPDQAAPLTGRERPDTFAALPRRPEARMDKQGKGEFVRILRVMETFSPEDVDAGIRAAPERGTIGFDACSVPDRAPAGGRS